MTKVSFSAVILSMAFVSKLSCCHAEPSFGKTLMQGHCPKAAEQWSTPDPIVRIHDGDSWRDYVSAFLDISSNLPVVGEIASLAGSIFGLTDDGGYSELNEALERFYHEVADLVDKSITQNNIDNDVVWINSHFGNIRDNLEMYRSRYEAGVASVRACDHLFAAQQEALALQNFLVQPRTTFSNAQFLNHWTALASLHLGVLRERYNLNVAGYCTDDDPDMLTKDTEDAYSEYYAGFISWMPEWYQWRMSFVEREDLKFSPNVPDEGNCGASVKLKDISCSGANGILACVKQAELINDYYVDPEEFCGDIRWSWTVEDKLTGVMCGDDYVERAESAAWAFGTERALKNEIAATMMAEMNVWAKMHRFIPGRENEGEIYPDANAPQPLSFYHHGIQLGPYRPNTGHWSRAPVNVLDTTLMAGFYPNGIIGQNVFEDDTIGVITGASWVSGGGIDWNQFQYHYGAGKQGKSKPATGDETNWVLNDVIQDGWIHSFRIYAWDVATYQDTGPYVGGYVGGVDALLTNHAGDSAYLGGVGCGLGCSNLVEMSLGKDFAMVSYGQSYTYLPDSPLVPANFNQWPRGGLYADLDYNDADFLNWRVQAAVGTIWKPAVLVIPNGNNRIRRGLRGFKSMNSTTV